MRARASGDGDPQPPEGEGFGCQDLLDRLPDDLLVDRCQPHADRRPLEPLEMRHEREGLSGHDLDRLEDAVAHGQAVVGDRESDDDAPRTRHRPRIWRRMAARLLFSASPRPGQPGPRVKRT